MNCERFVKCEACSHFFVVLSEADQRVKVKDVKQAEQVTSSFDFALY